MTMLGVGLVFLSTAAFALGAVGFLLPKRDAIRQELAAAGRAGVRERQEQ